MSTNYRSNTTSKTRAESAPQFSAKALILLSMGLLIAAVATIRYIQ